MNNEDSTRNSKNLANELEKLIIVYRKKVDCGVVFKLAENEYPLELLKVLNLLKDKLQKWGNDNLFTYSGNAFDRNKIVVIGADSSDHAVDLIMLVFLTELSKKNNVEIQLDSQKGIEEYYKSEFSSKIIEGYPEDLEIETLIKSHINNILNELLDSN